MSRLPKLLWVMAAALLLLATLRLPYGCYTFLRIAICAFCAAVAVFGFLEKSVAWATAFALIAVLFNPILPIYLKRVEWFWLDVGAAAIIAAHLGYRIFAERKPAELNV